LIEKFVLHFAENTLSNLGMLIIEMYVFKTHLIWDILHLFLILSSAYIIFERLFA